MLPTGCNSLDTVLPFFRKERPTYLGKLYKIWINEVGWIEHEAKVVLLLLADVEDVGPRSLHEENPTFNFESALESFDSRATEGLDRWKRFGRASAVWVEELDGICYPRRLE